MIRPPPVCIQQLIYTIKFTQPPLLRLLLGEHPPRVNIIYTCPQAECRMRASLLYLLLSSLTDREHFTAAFRL